jgi:uncharacterized repeat protein (TIGR01451 family)
MNVKIVRPFHLLLVVVVMLASGVALVSPGPAPAAAQAGRSADIALQAAGRGNPYVNLQDGVALPNDYAGDAVLIQDLLDGQARPLSLAVGDFDEDGVPDLVAGYAGPSGGILSLHRGNVDSIYPNSPEAQAHKAAGTFSEAPFLSPAQVFALPVPPDFLGAGDFDDDGHLDAVVAARGDATLYLLPGDGLGGFGPVQPISLPGSVTALVVGEVNRRDGLADLAVAVKGADELALLIFEGPEGALRREPETIPLPAEAGGLALGQFDGDYPLDLAVATGNELLIVHGRDRKLSLDASQQAEVPPAAVDTFSLPYAVVALTAGNFALDPQGSYHLELALLATDGTLHILDPVSGQEISHSPLPNSPLLNLQPANVSSLPTDDLLLLDPANHQLHLWLTGPIPNPQSPISNPVTLELVGEPLAVLPMRLNADALDDLVVLQAGIAAPAVVPTAPLGTFTVTSTGDEGDTCAAGDGVCAATELQGDPPVCSVVAGCTLRAALDEANAGAGADTILFGLPGGGLYTIQVPTPLFADRPVTLDGTSQPGYAGSPLIELTGSPDVDLYAAGGDTVVRGLAFTAAAQHGLQVDNYYGWNGGNTILEGNYFGLKPGGTQCGGNTGLGVSVWQATDTRIGGTTEAARNVISCNSGHGVQISESTAATLNRVIGNYIGTDVNGTADKGNSGAGVAIASGPNNDVGGTTAAERNVIAGNHNGTGSGVVIAYADAAGNLVAGNYVGVDKNGVSLGNASDGVALVDDAHHNTVGGTAGTTPGGACSGACNLISGNGRNGVYLGSFTAQSAPARTAEPGRAAPALLLADAESPIPNPESPIPTSVTGNVVQGNTVGTTADGLQALGNVWDGVDLEDAPGNTVGGGVAAARNVISGNKKEGVSISGAAATGNTVQGNYIGTDTAGEQKVPNIWNGVRLDGAPGNTVKSNVISGNEENGVLVSGSGASGNTVQDNVIGAGPWEDKVLGNAHDGVQLDGAPGNTVKGNVIGGNGQNWQPYPDAGVKIVGSGASGNLVQGNSLGVDTAGMINLGNVGNGVLIDSAPGNTIGGAAASDGNLISRNRGDGIYIQGQGAAGNTLKHNQIGTDRAGTTAMGNSGGVSVQGAPGTVVESNLISGNDGNGLDIAGATAANTQVQGNYIGTNLAGDGKLQNDGQGVMVFGTASYTQIEDNLISGNRARGVLVIDAAWTTLRGNRIGTNAAGTAGLGNGSDGIAVGSSTHTVIGDVGRSVPVDACTGGCNLISGNSRKGVLVSGSPDSQVMGNYIGTSLSGNAGLGNTENGVEIDGAVVQGNVIADNGRAGVATNVGSSILIVRNYIGTGADGTTALGNKQWGVYMAGGLSPTIDGNRIWFNPIGLYVDGANVFHNSVSNSPGPVYGKGIDCHGSDVVGNQIADNDVGISMFSGSCQAHRNNIQGNSPYGVYAREGQLDATDNWWGAANGPGGAGPGSGDQVSANVLYDPWLGAPVAVEVSPGGTVYGPPGASPAEAEQAVSGWIYVQNWAHPTDVLQVTVADSQGWLVSPASFTVPISDGLGGSALVSFTIPAGTPIGTASVVTVQAVSQANPADADTGTFQVIAALPADLALDKTSDVSSATVGGQIHYTLLITNAGPNPASSAVVTDLLPAEVAFVSAAPSQGTCAELTGTVVCELGGLAVDAQAAVDLAVTVVASNEEGEIVNGAWVAVTGGSEYDPDLDNNGDSVITEVLTSTRVYLPLVLRTWSPPATWHSQAADAPPYIEEVTPRSLAVDAAGHPHAAYGGDYLYYAWDDGSGWQSEVVDSSRGVGRWASLALDSAGRPHIAYKDDTHGCLKYARFDGAVWSVETVDCEGGNTGSYVSLALDGAGHPRIAYHSYAFDALKAAQWDGTQWQITTVETGQSGYSSMVGAHNSLVVDGAGRPHILYSESGSVAEPYRLKQASWDGTQWQIAVVEVGDCCYENSAALDSAGHIHVVYQTYAGSDAVVKHAHWDGSQWQFETVVAMSEYWPYGLSMVLDGADRVHLSYYHRLDAAMDLRYVHWDGTAWQVSTVEHVLSGINYDEVSSLALSGGQPQVLYQVGGAGLVKHARWDGNTWQIETVDEGGDVGRYSSLVLDTAGRPHVSYFDAQAGKLKYAAWDGAAWHNETVDQGSAGFNTLGPVLSLALDSAGQPHIGYYFYPAGEVRYASWTGTAWQIEAVEDANFGGASMALDSANRPHFTYRGSDGSQRYARWDGSTWQFQTVDSAGSFYGRLVLDSTGHPHLAYDPNYALKYAWWDGAAWHVELVDDSGQIWLLSLALDSADRPHISYFDDTADVLKHAWWDGVQWHKETVDSSGRVGLYSSIALDSADRPHISYFDATAESLKYARWDGSQWLIETVETGNVGSYTSLVLDGNDWPHITHYDSAMKDLRYTWFGP